MYFKFPEEYHAIDAHNHIWGTDQTRMDQLLAAADALGIEKLCISVPLKDRVVPAEKFRSANDAIIHAMQYSSRFMGFCFVDAAADMPLHEDRFGIAFQCFQKIPRSTGVRFPVHGVRIEKFPGV